MRYLKTPLEGAYLIELEKKEDERGFFARFFCTKEFEKENLEKGFVQVNNSFSEKKGTLRGMHYQLSPKAETKLVRCIKGSLYDVIVDLRPESKTFMQSFGAELTAENRMMMYVPRGFGHGFITFEDHTEALYMVSEFYSPEHERGLCFDDPALNISWPLTPAVVSEKDRQHRPFDINYHV